MDVFIVLIGRCKGDSLICVLLIGTSKVVRVKLFARSSQPSYMFGAGNGGGEGGGGGVRTVLALLCRVDSTWCLSLIFC